MRVLVTGARGFIGSLLVERLLKEGVEVVCLLRSKKNPDIWLDGLEIEVTPGDITDPESLQDAVKDVDYIYHLAGLTRAPNRETFNKVNCEGTRNLLQAVIDTGTVLQRFILVSSLAASGPSQNGEKLTEDNPAHPISNYGRSKLRAEEIALEVASKIPVTIVRPPVVFGPRDTDVYEIFKYNKRGLRPVITGGPRYVSVIYVEDLVEGLILAAISEKAVGKCYYLCNDRYHSLEELEDIIADAVSAKPRKIYVPIQLAWGVACILELLGRITNRPFVFNLDKYRELKATHWICDNSAAKSELAFEPKFDIKTAMKKTAEWYLSHGWL